MSMPGEHQRQKNRQVVTVAERVDGLALAAQQTLSSACRDNLILPPSHEDTEPRKAACISCPSPDRLGVASDSLGSARAAP
mmetsp:Transcript_17196/g.46890  ORF Transcript_17196/g.46890 Transcript_17196/m.46890 type:complete len:81 (+) Transcript_17196:238-480(+)